MAQFSPGNIDGNVVDGPAFVTIFNQWRAALESGHSGPTEPPYAVRHMTWMDTASDNTVLRYRNDTSSIALAVYDDANQVWRFALDADGDSYFSAPVDDQMSVTIAGIERARVTANGVLSNVEGQFVSAVPRFGTGTALPGADVGVIWHDDFGVMTWQVFANNGAAYTGYASADVGQIVIDGQPIPRARHLGLNGATVSEVTYQGLIEWARHNGLVVAAASWTAGAFVFGDNGDGTLILPDLRGEFPRFWDDGRGIDLGRLFGTGQGQANEDHTHDESFSIAGGTMRMNDGEPFGTNGTPYTASRALTFNSTSVGDQYARTSGQRPSGSGETRPRNVALLASIKF